MEKVTLCVEEGMENRNEKRDCFCRSRNERAENDRNEKSRGRTACLFIALPEEEYLHLSAAEIYRELKKMNSAALRGFNPNQFAQVLTKMGVGRKHTECGNVYSVTCR